MKFDLFFISIKTTYAQFEIDSLLEEPMDVNLNSLANVAGESSNDEQSVLKLEEIIGRNGIQIDDYDDKDVVVETIERALPCECDTIADQNPFDSQK